MPSTRSSAATKCISEVPGLAKQTSTPAPTSVRMSACAPFTARPWHAGPGRATSPDENEPAADAALGQQPVRLRGLLGRERPIDPQRQHPVLHLLAQPVECRPVLRD